MQTRSGSTEFRRSGRLWCQARSSSTGFRRRLRRRFREALVQSQVRFNRVAKKDPEKVWEALVQSQVRFNKVPEKVPRSGSTGFRRRSGEGLGGFDAGSTGSGEGCREGQKVFGNLWCRARSGSNRFNRVSSAWLPSALQKDL